MLQFALLSLRLSHLLSISLRLSISLLSRLSLRLILLQNLLWAGVGGSRLRCPETVVSDSVGGAACRTSGRAAAACWAHITRAAAAPLLISAGRTGAVGWCRGLAFTLHGDRV